MTEGTRSARILIIDDEEVYCTQLGAILERQGHEVRSARSGREGIEIGRRFRPEILLVDWALADERNGMEIAEILRTNDPALKVIPITGYSAEDILRSTRIPVTHILEKPFGIQQVLEAIRLAISGDED
jgi:DNA-binding NtrC family response regulator